jgi:hypothetical protein
VREGQTTGAERTRCYTPAVMPRDVAAPDRPPRRLARRSAFLATVHPARATAPRFVVAALILVLLPLATGHARTAAPDETWDLIVVGSEPEAIAAAVTAAEEGARTLLLSSDPRLGGLFVRGALNVLDLRSTPVDFQRGLFERWWRRVGRLHAFDVLRGERAFADLLAQAGVEVRLSQPPPRPWMVDGRVVGVLVGTRSLAAGQVVDGTADADLAAAAGARSSWGFGSIGWHARMADTLVFRIDRVDWDGLRRGIGERGRNYAYADDRVAYGHFGGHPAAYRAEGEGLRLRGLNLGRQDDGTVLVNALLIYGVDPLDAASRAEGRLRAAAEIDRIVAWLAQDLPGFQHAVAGGVADDLYVRQTRHLEALCQLTIDDVVDHVVTDQDVAAGGYPLDVQTLRPTDDGFVLGMPEIYGGRLCMTVPDDVAGLWVVGRSAGYDPLAHASARVVPFGMAMAEAVGVAAAWSLSRGLDPAAVATDPDAIAAVRTRLLDRGVYLPPVAPRAPAGPVQHPHYVDFRTMLRWGLAVGGYGNDPVLDAEVSPAGLIYLLANVGQRALDDATAGSDVIRRFGLPTGALTASDAAMIVGAFLRYAGLVTDPGVTSWADLSRLGLPLAEPARALRRGEIYALASWVLDLADRRYPPSSAGRPASSGDGPPAAPVASAPAR